MWHRRYSVDGRSLSRPKDTAGPSRNQSSISPQRHGVRSFRTLPSAPPCETSEFCFTTETQSSQSSDQELFPLCPQRLVVRYPDSWLHHRGTEFTEFFPPRPQRLLVRYPNSFFTTGTQSSQSSDQELLTPCPQQYSNAPGRPIFRQPSSRARSRTRSIFLHTPPRPPRLLVRYPNLFFTTETQSSQSSDQALFPPRPQRLLVRYPDSWLHHRGTEFTEFGVCFDQDLFTLCPQRLVVRYPDSCFTAKAQSSQRINSVGRGAQSKGRRGRENSETFAIPSSW